MRRIFCDKCNDEITPENHYHSSSLRIDVVGYVLAIVCEESIENMDICKYCVIDGFSKLDDRLLVRNKNEC